MEKQDFLRYWNKHRKALYAYCSRRATKGHIDDVYQNIMVVLLRKYESASFDNEDAFKAWMYKVAFIEILKSNDMSNKHKGINIDILSEDIADIDSGKFQETMENVELVEKLLNTLEPLERKVVKLYYYKLKSYADIGKIIGKSDSAVGMICRRAINKMAIEANRIFRKL